MPENANDSPRISFSNDFCHCDSIPIEQRSYQSSSFHWGFAFDFSIPGDVNSGESSSSAEEFFNDGKILPTEIKKIPEPINLVPDNNNPEIYKTGLPKPDINPIEDVKPVFEIEEVGDKEDEVKLPLLRNNSTGSNSLKLQALYSSSSLNDRFQKPPLKKNHGGYSYRGNGGEIRVSSFLDVVPSGNLFGLGSINFGGGRTKIKMRSMFFYW